MSRQTTSAIYTPASIRTKQLFTPAVKTPSITPRHVQPPVTPMKYAMILLQFSKILVILGQVVS